MKRLLVSVLVALVLATGGAIGVARPVLAGGCCMHGPLIYNDPPGGQHVWQLCVTGYNQNWSWVEFCIQSSPGTTFAEHQTFWLGDDWWQSGCCAISGFQGDIFVSMYYTGGCQCYYWVNATVPYQSQCWDTSFYVWSYEGWTTC